MPWCSRWTLCSVGMLGFGVMIAASAGAQTIAVTNGDFESPTIGPGNFTLAAPPGWSLVTGGATDVGLFHPTEALASRPGRYSARTGRRRLDRG